MESLDSAVLHGPDIAAGEPGAERSDLNYRDVILEVRLRQTLVQLNANLPHDAIGDAFRKDVTLDWTVRESVREKLRVLVKHILRKYGYPLDKQEQATQTVLERTALLSIEWTN